MALSKTILKYILPASVLFGTLLTSVVLYRVVGKSRPPFLTTSSPLKTYTLSLTGQKERPLFFTAEVRFDVLKNGTPFLSNKYLHSGDALFYTYSYLDAVINALLKLLFSFVQINLNGNE